MNLREIADAFLREIDNAGSYEEIEALPARLESLLYEREQAAFEMAASRLLDLEMPLGAVVAIRELAKERAKR